MVKVEPYDGFRVSFDCGETFYVHQYDEEREVSCNNDDCSRSFQISVVVDEDDGYGEEVDCLGRLPA